jgi:hypothetical protein
VPADIGLAAVLRDPAGIRHPSWGARVDAVIVVPASSALADELANDHGDQRGREK